jgi:Luciferase-like monooxygenase
MKFGLILNTQFLAGEDAHVKVRELVDQVRAARDAGFDSVAVSHHYLLTPQPLPAPPAVAGGAAAARPRADRAHRPRSHSELEIGVTAPTSPRA